MKQELYEAQLQLKTKNAFIDGLQNDIEQLQSVEDEYIKLKSALTTKELDLKQWNVKVINIEYLTIFYLNLMVDISFIFTHTYIYIYFSILI